MESTKISWILTRAVNAKETEEYVLHINKYGKCIIVGSNFKTTGGWSNQTILSDDNDEVYFLKNRSEWNDVMAFIKNNKS